MYISFTRKAGISIAITGFDLLTHHIVKDAGYEI
jgi:hypothetical protein